MKNTFPSYCKKFECIADKCPDTCCAGWGIVVDSESFEKYSAISNAYGDKIRSLISVDEDGDRIFTPCGGRCPFLLESGLCEMHIELGHENLCRTCRLFPRHITSFGARIETGISLSCPEAARLIFESPDPVTLESENIGGEIIPSDFDAELYFTLLEARKKAIDILQRRDFSIEKRICAFLEFSKALQECIKHGDYEEAASMNADTFFITKQSFSLSKSKRALNKYFSDFGSLEFINPDFSEKLSTAQSVDMQGFSAPDWEYEHLMIYFVFRYFTAGVFDGNILAKAKFAAVSFIIIKRLHASLDAFSKEQRTEIAQKYSKEIEHSALNMDFLFSSIRKSRYYSVENLTNILSEEVICNEIS